MPAAREPERDTATGHARPPDAAELAFVREARIGRLATVDARSRPTVVPFCFAVVEGETPVVVSVLDEKPKRVADAALARVRNIAANPAVAFVVDRYEEDWTRLAWVRLRGRAAILAPGEAGHGAAIAALRAKYPQYATMTLESRPVIAISGLSAASWRGDGQPFA